MRRQFLLLLMLVAFASLALQAADLTGKWVAQVPGRQGNTSEWTFTFKQEGDKLTGTIATQRGENPISDGKVSGDQVSFSQSMEFNGNAFKFNYKGTVSGDYLKLTREREGGGGGGGKGGPTEITAKRKAS
jgi:hypothetical protein